MREAASAAARPAPAPALLQSTASMRNTAPTAAASHVLANLEHVPSAGGGVARQAPHAHACAGHVAASQAVLVNQILLHAAVAAAAVMLIQPRAEKAQQPRRRRGRARPVELIGAACGGAGGLAARSGWANQVCLAKCTKPLRSSCGPACRCWPPWPTWLDAHVRGAGSSARLVRAASLQWRKGERTASAQRLKVSQTGLGGGGAQ